MARDCERARARAFAARHLAEPISRFDAEVGLVPRNLLFGIATAGGADLTDMAKRCREGNWVGEVFMHYFALCYHRSEVASWGNAFRHVSAVARPGEKSTTRSQFFEVLRRYKTAAHLWGAWVMRGERLNPDPGAGYSKHDDYHAFLFEAEQLREWGQSWKPGSGMGEPPLPDEVWELPPGWMERKRAASGLLRMPKLEPDILKSLKGRGRPRITSA